ncbi:MAG: LysR substrate-binding domain-containing protein [Steroidobacteraceae bacterium]
MREVQCGDRGSGSPPAGQQPTARQLQKAEWIALDRLPRADADLQRYFEGARVKPPIASVRTEATGFAIAWVARTQFLCALPSRAVARAVAGGEVTVLDVALTDPAWSLVAGYRRSAPKSPPMLSFIEGLREALR